MITKKSDGFSSTHLNKSLLVFFKDALRVAIKSPAQTWAFLRTLRCLRQAAKKRAYWKAQDVPVPPIIIFSITNECNLECEGCYAQALHSHIEEELNDEELERIVSEASDLGVSFFVIAGGEPLKRPEFFNISQDFPEIIFLIFTNGLLIDNDMIIKFRNQKNVVPLISLEGYEKDTDDRRGKGTFEVLQKTMVKMNKENIFWGTSLTLTKPTFSTLIDHKFIEQYVKIGCKFFLETVI